METWQSKLLCWSLVFTLTIFPSYCSDISDKFYSDCGTPHKLCSGIGPDSNCIETQTCKYAGAVSENATAFILQFYEITKKDDILRPCIASLTLLNDVDETTSWIRDHGWNTELHCKNELKLENFFPALYVNKTTSCENVTSTSYGESLTTSSVSKATWKQYCEDRLGNMSSTSIDVFSAHGKMVTITGGASIGTGCSGKYSPWDWPHSFSEAFKDMKPVTDGSPFHTNVKSVSELYCATSSGNQIRNILTFPSVTFGIAYLMISLS